MLVSHCLSVVWFILSGTECSHGINIGHGAIMANYIGINVNGLTRLYYNHILMSVSSLQPYKLQLRLRIIPILNVIGAH